MIYALVLGFVIFVGVMFWAFRRGRESQRLDTAETNNAVKKKQLEAAANRPRDRDELAGRLRDGEF